MSTRVTDFDKTVAKRIRHLRSESGLTQAQVAGHLGITYQSYQKMERGVHSFRLHTLDRLGQLYNLTFADLLKPGADTPLCPDSAQALWAMHQMSEDRRKEALQAVLAIKQRSS